MEMRVRFTLSGKDYCLFIERGLLRIKRITLLQICKGDPMGSARQIPIKISANTLEESRDNWLINVILHLLKRRNQIPCSPGRADPGEKRNRKRGVRPVDVRGE